MDKEKEIKFFNLAAEGHRITLEAVKSLEEKGIHPCAAILVALENCVFEPSKKLSLEEQADIFASMQLFIEQRSDILGKEMEEGRTA